MPVTILKPGDVDPLWERKARRVLLSGPPNSGKTTSLRTFPKPMGYVAYPGEAGLSALDRTDVVVASWGDLDITKGVDWSTLLKEVKQTTADMIAGKYGEIKTFVGDGLHKLFGLFLNVVTGGASATSLDFDPKLYADAGKQFFLYLDRVKQSPIETVVFTVWDGAEKDDPDAKDKDTQKHIFPELPGKAAKLIMGEFSVALASTVQGVGAGAKYLWQTRPMGKVWGCGIKAPTGIASKIETFVPQDWGALQRVLLPTITQSGGAK